MNIKLCKAAEKILELTPVFEKSNFTWWPEHKLADTEEIKRILKQGKFDDRDLETYTLHRMAKYMIETKREHAYIHSERELPSPEDDKLYDNDIENLSTYQKPRTLRINTGSWENLQEGWTTLTADFEDVFKSTADYFFHGYKNEAGDDFAAHICVRWAGGLREVLASNGPKPPSLRWVHQGFPDLFVCLNYDDIVRLYKDFVVSCDPSYWVDKGVALNFGERIPE